ncbi:MAG: HAD family phosphatase [Chitinophagaceae bacterium]|nr:HAD family phosphatase [Chitinophagaceae bacterium]
MQKVKNIIFDLGGVLLTLDYSKTEQSFINLGVANFNELYNQQKASPLFEQLETGKIDNEAFYQQFKNIANVTLADSDMEVAWCAMLGHFPDEVLIWLDEIRQKYNIYLFSNTNRIHHQSFQKIYQQQTGKKNFDDFFIKAWYSHDLGLRKPYAQAFTKLLEIENLQPGETLFIDDSLVNIEGAKEAGLQTIWLQSPLTVLELGL